MNNTGKPVFVNSLGMEMVEVEAGAFIMGSNKGNWDELPLHEVSISNSFYISREEITLKQYRQFNPSYSEDSRTGKVIGVSWLDAVAFSKWLSIKEGKTYRLPTEAEWEFAAKNTTPTSEIAIEGMLDNILEWCFDWHGEYRVEKQIDPIGPDKGMVRVIRGGKIDGDFSDCDSFQDGDSRVIASHAYSRNENRAGMPPDFGENGLNTQIGFRVVQADMPATIAYSSQPKLFCSGVKQTTEEFSANYKIEKPYFRKRFLLPSPPESYEGSDGQKEFRPLLDVIGFHPSFRGHQHSPGLEVLPNGDVLFVIYTSWSEYEPEVSLIASRLRFGQDKWEMPDYAFDFVGANDHGPMLYRDGKSVHLFWGSPLIINMTPFQWITSQNNGASWGKVNFPNFVTPVGEHSRQPINTAFRNADGKIFVSSDGIGNSSLLWVSEDNMKTWMDYGGRTFGRHTTFALASDGRTIIGMGGKKSGIDGYMTISTSIDEGKTWVKSKSVFPIQGSNQRPSILRLESGILLMAGDYRSKNGDEAATFNSETGSYLAFSKDDGMTWTFKDIPGVSLHEDSDSLFTLGYTAMRQAPNGFIHLITTMNKPIIHFEFNEAWVKSNGPDPHDDKLLMQNTASSINQVNDYHENYPNGQKHIEWSAGIANDGRYIQNGDEKWYYPDGKLKYEATFLLGDKIGKEVFYNDDGSKIWEWHYNKNGKDIYTVYYRNGRKKAESQWKDFHADGTAQSWDINGQVEAILEFDMGVVKEVGK